MKQSHAKLLKALLENPRMSDRALAKLVGVSQPTVSRTRAKLTKDGILTFHAFPNLPKIGYKILAFSEIDGEQIVDPEVLKQLPHLLEDDSNVIYAGIQPGKVFIISAHVDIDDYTTFKLRYAIPYLRSNYLVTGLLKTVKPLQFSSLINHLENSIAEIWAKRAAKEKP